MANPSTEQIPDRAERQQALDINRSFIVQAPAGSGKTELLIQRILALLAKVEAPEEILAITFTRKAAGEMKVRLLDALDQAAQQEPPAELHKKETWERARAVLEQDRVQQWNLRQNPARLQIMTIDSFCASISRRMPWLARLGEQPGVSEDVDQLYLQAAESLLAKLETDAQWGAPIEYMLQHLDNRLVQLRQLLVAMLSKRDQWLRYLIDDKGRSRKVLEEALEQYVASTIDSACQTLGGNLCSELTALAIFAANNLAHADSPNTLAPFLGYKGDLSDGFASRDQWLALASLVLTDKNQIRKKVNVKNGFPSDKSADAPLMKTQMHELLGQLAEEPAKTRALQTLRDLPTPGYNHEQWQALQCLIALLPMAVIELRNVFRSTGQVDFIEIAGSARAALGAADAPEELLLQLDSAIRHILVDEYQDTSYTQYDLLLKLTSGWEQGDGRSLFVVGDPMQSIYRFREADVGLFLKAVAEGIGNVQLEALTLMTNFRSQATLVDWFNQKFPSLFPSDRDILTGAVPYKNALSIQAGLSDPPVTQQYFIDRQDDAEAEAVLTLVQTARQCDPDGSIAVLVRSRSHLKKIISKFRENGLRFQAQDLDLLSDRPIAHDIVSLTRALLHTGDTVSWLSLLRASWAGLTLNDLLVLADGPKGVPLIDRIGQNQGQVEMFSTLRRDGRERLERVRIVVEQALEQRGRIGLRRLIESTWMSLGGPATVDEAGLADAEQVFALLDDLDSGGDLLRLDDFEQGLARLYATPDPAATAGLQIMTIHKAKGLEFDTVIIPGLGRIPRRNEKSILRWLEHPDYGLLLAPVPPIGADEDDIYRAIGRIQQQRDDHETLRLFYVAATRAKKQLHLLGHLNESGDDIKPAGGSLLGSVWETISTDSFIIRNDEEPADEVRQKAYIQRLPANWQLPELSASIQTSDNTVITASDVGSSHLSNNRFSLRTEEGRLIGTVVHRWLELIAGEGVDRFQGTDIGQHLGQINRELSNRGIPADRLDDCAAKVLQSLQKMLVSEQGRWILTAHAEQACELELSGLVAGELVHASIDRTFIVDGIRWIIDYKTSSPASGENVELFLQKESDLYRSQIETYMALFRQLDSSIEVKGALYFPLIDAWKTISD